MSNDGAIFRWETLQVITACLLRFEEEEIHGVTMEVELISGRRVNIFRPDDGVSYFCHGLTFGGKDAPGGAVSPYSGASVRGILDDFFIVVSPESAAVTSDIVVWTDADGDPIHTAILLMPIVASDLNRLDYATILRSKNGRRAEGDVTLESLVASDESYGESYRVYRRR